MLTSVGEGRVFFVYILVRVPALGAVMVESAVSRLTRALNAVRETKIFNKRSLWSLVMLAVRQERGEHGEYCGVTLLLPCNCHFKKQCGRRK